MALPDQPTLKRTSDTEHRRQRPAKQNRQEQLADVMAKRRHLLAKHQAKMAAQHAAGQEPLEEHEAPTEGFQHDA